MTRYNILVTGVGGQGLLTLGRIVGNAAILAGMDATIAETHGLSQRGGSLIVQIRLGEGESPLIPRGAADLIIGMEVLETARRIVYANPNTRVAMNKFLWPPPLADYPDLEQVVNKIKETGVKLYMIDANKISEDVVGSVISANMVMLGFAYAVDEGLKKLFEKKHFLQAMVKVFRGKAVELNKKAFEAGYEEGLKQA